MISRNELSAAVQQGYVRGCKCSQYKRSRDCNHLLAQRNRLERDTVLLTLLLDLRDVIAEAMLVRTLVADMLSDEGRQRSSERSTEWVWVTPSADLTRGTLDDGIVHAYATVLLNHALVTIRAEENTMEMSATLPAWSQSQQRRWVEQWVASQSDAAVAAFEATEGMR